MRSRQLAERLGVEEAHMLEYQQFNMDWDRKMGEFENHANDLVDAMRQRHQVRDQLCPYVYPSSFNQQLHIHILAHIDE